jgi:hypothetical protein
MPHELPVNWTEIEKACIAGVPQRQVAKDVAAKTAGAVTVDQLYKAIRKRASREQWPIPASIMRRARTVALVAAGEAATAKDAATWRKGESGRTQGGAMLATLGIEHQERKAAELLQAGDASPNEIGKQEQGQIGGAAGAGLLVGGEPCRARPSPPPSLSHGRWPSAANPAYPSPLMPPLPPSPPSIQRPPSPSAA